MKPIICISGISGSGKTTMVEKLIPELISPGYRVASVKHDAHRFEIDHPGKDSYRLAPAGAAVTLISSPEKLALVRRHDAAPGIEEMLRTRTSERQCRVIDYDESGSMEEKKREGYL